MEQGLNRVLLIGRVDGDPEIRHTPSGQPVSSFSIATRRSWTAADGQEHEETEWFNIVAWGNLAERCFQQLSAGKRVYIEGRLQTRGWEDSQGRKHLRTEVVAQDMIALSDQPE